MRCFRLSRPTTVISVLTHWRKSRKIISCRTGSVLGFGAFTRQTPGVLRRWLDETVYKSVLGSFGHSATFWSRVSRSSCSESRCIVLPGHGKLVRIPPSGPGVRGRLERWSSAGPRPFTRLLSTCWQPWCARVQMRQTGRVRLPESKESNRGSVRLPQVTSSYEEPRLTAILLVG